MIKMDPVREAFEYYISFYSDLDHYHISKELPTYEEFNSLFPKFKSYMNEVFQQDAYEDGVFESVERELFKYMWMGYPPEQARRLYSGQT